MLFLLFAWLFFPGGGGSFLFLFFSGFGFPGKLIEIDLANNVNVDGRLYFFLYYRFGNFGGGNFCSWFFYRFGRAFSFLFRLWRNSFHRLYSLWPESLIEVDLAHQFYVGLLDFLPDIYSLLNRRSILYNNFLVPVMFVAPGFRHVIDGYCLLSPVEILQHQLLRLLLDVEVAAVFLLQKKVSFARQFCVWIRIKIKALLVEEFHNCRDPDVENAGCFAQSCCLNIFCHRYVISLS